MKLVRPLVVLDTETTGEHPGFDRIVEIGLVKVYPDGRETSWQTLVNPGIRIPPEVTEIHGITDEMVRDAPSFASKEVGGILHAGLNDCTIAGFHVNFDLRFVKAEYARVNALAPEWRAVIDAARIAQIMEPRTLTAAVKRYLGEEFEGAHRADVDAKATLRVLRAQLAEYQELPAEIDGLAKLLQTPRSNHIDPEGKFAWRFGVAIVNFGNKHLGKTLEVVARTDRGYLEWMLRNDFSQQAHEIVANALKGIYPTRTV